MQEREPTGHVVKDGAFQRDGDEGLGRQFRLGIQNVVETGRQLLHDQRRHRRAGQETHAQELDDVRVAEGAHQLTLSHELRRRFLDAFARHLSRVLEKVVDLLGGAHGSGNGHLLHAAVRSSPDSPARGSSGGEKERTKVGVIAEERLGCHFTGFALCVRENLGWSSFRDTHAHSWQIMACVNSYTFFFFSVSSCSTPPPPPHTHTHTHTHTHKVPLILLQKMDLLLKKTSPEDFRQHVLPTIISSLETTNTQLQVYSQLLSFCSLFKFKLHCS